NQSIGVNTTASGQFSFTRRVKPGSYTIRVDALDRANVFKSVTLENIAVAADETVTRTVDVTLNPVGEILVRGVAKKTDGTGAASRVVYFSGLPYNSFNYAFTNANGMFEYRQWVPIQTYAVYATTSDPFNFSVQSPTQSVTADPNTVTEINFALQDPQTAVLAINGQITDAEGFAYINKPVYLEVRSSDKLYTRVVNTDSAGAYETTLRTLEGTHSARIEVSDVNGLENYAQLDDLTLTATAPTTRTLNLELRSTGHLALNGTVRSAGGSTVNTFGSVEFTSGAFSRSASLNSDSSGRYTLAAQKFPAGTYRVDLRMYDYNFGEYQTVRLENVVVTAGQTTTQALDLDFKRLEVSGTVRDSTNQPVAGATVSVNVSSNDARCLTCSAVTDAAGRYQIAVSPRPSRTNLSYQLEVRKDAIPRASMPVPRSRRTPRRKT
ncbi:MAG: carboxypeptidase regulatory-like domain-containing protein, partial [Pleurocapsa sp. SU_196_0]|nr:carboxypeptidase regulatory-like domain-containing protein [Pleurocapsa sp. SU_196_0]